MENLIYLFNDRDGISSECEMFIDEVTGLVIVTELASNEGTSITSCAEHLAEQITQKYNIDPKNLVWIEHFGVQSYSDHWMYQIYNEGKERFDLVTFDILEGKFSNARRKRLSEAALLHYVFLLKKAFTESE